MSDAAPRCTVMITTRNRREELRQTLGKLRELSPKLEEILICVHDRTDDTATLNQPYY